MSSFSSFHRRGSTKSSFGSYDSFEMSFEDDNSTDTTTVLASSLKQSPYLSSTQPPSSTNTTTIEPRRMSSFTTLNSYSSFDSYTAFSSPPAVSPFNRTISSTSVSALSPSYLTVGDEDMSFEYIDSKNSEARRKRNTDGCWKNSDIAVYDNCEESSNLYEMNMFQTPEKTNTNLNYSNLHKRPKTILMTNSKGTNVNIDFERVCEDLSLTINSFLSETYIKSLVGSCSSVASHTSTDFLLESKTSSPLLSEVTSNLKFQTNNKTSRRGMKTKRKLADDFLQTRNKFRV